MNNEIKFAIIMTSVNSFLMEMQDQIFLSGY